ncbi:uncharacterized protein [Battus philenor]|uniref:uncharacterized protein n=1 Tax=Battus philenor TaxID=42288 RepID=UPI0035D0B20B
MDPLIKIPLSTWPKLRELFSVNWPKGAAAYCLLDTQINSPNLIEKFNFKVYCPFGDLNNGFVGLTDKSGCRQVIIQPLNDTSKIEEALLKTKIINWDRTTIVPFASPGVLQLLIKLSNRINISINYDDGKAIKYLFTKNSLNFDLSIPEDVYIAPLRSKDIDIVNKTWTYENEHSVEFFETLMENDMTYVLYNIEDDKPLAWITINEAGALTHLFCLELFRRNGYAELVTKYACNDLLRKGRHIIAYTIEENEKPQNLFEKLGFKNIGYDYWIVLKRIN